MAAETLFDEKVINDLRFLFAGIAKESLQALTRFQPIEMTEFAAVKKQVR
jgi:hypothetical protein